MNTILLFIRHMIAILFMPFIIVVIVPIWLLNTFGHIDTRWENRLAIVWLFRTAGIVVGFLGLLLFGWCVTLFARVGKGTLAPWDPTQDLVGVGPYRYVRNPMISGVALLLMGQALYRGSWMLGILVAIFILINHIYFVLAEEPGLEMRFPGRYRVYKENVPRWIPRIKPWLGK